MPMQAGQIRPLVLVIINHNGRTLVSPGHDHVKGVDFYRLLGGGIEFGEDSLSALRREIKEELGLELKNYQLLNIQENIFEFNGHAGHEICFIYRADLASEEIYQKESVQILDETNHQAIWLAITPENITKIKPEVLDSYFS